MFGRWNRGYMLFRPTAYPHEVTIWAGEARLPVDPWEEGRVRRGAGTGLGGRGSVPPPVLSVQDIWWPFPKTSITHGFFTFHLA